MKIIIKASDEVIESVWLKIFELLTEDLSLSGVITKGGYIINATARTRKPYQKLATHDFHMKIKRGNLDEQ